MSSDLVPCRSMNTRSATDGQHATYMHIYEYDDFVYNLLYAVLYPHVFGFRRQCIYIYINIYIYIYFCCH
jgi:hypothetical protein